MDSLERRREDPQSINQNVEMRPISSGDGMNQIFLLLCKYHVPAIASILGHQPNSGNKI